MTRDTDLIRRALVEMFGERCPDFDPDCVGCQAWAEFDRLTAQPAQEPPSPGVTAGATGEWDTQRVALSIAAMVEEWYDGGWRDHLPFHLIEKRLNRYANPSATNSCQKRGKLKSHMATKTLFSPQPKLTTSPASSPPFCPQGRGSDEC